MYGSVPLPQLPSMPCIAVVCDTCVHVPLEHVTCMGTIELSARQVDAGTRM